MNNENGKSYCKWRKKTESDIASEEWKELVNLWVKKESRKWYYKWRMKMESDLASEEWKQKVILQVKNENRKWICEWRIERGLSNDESESGNWRKKLRFWLSMKVTFWQPMKMKVTLWVNHGSENEGVE